MGGQRSAPAALPPEQSPGTHFIGGWVSPGPGLDGCRKSRLHLHRLNYTGPPHNTDKIIILFILISLFLGQQIVSEPTAFFLLVDREAGQYCN